MSEPNTIQLQTDGGEQSDPQTQPQPQGDPQRPAWLPEKFADGEALAKAYSELEVKLGAAPPKPNISTDPKGLDGLRITPKAEESAPPAVDMAAVSREYLQNDGQISDETYESLQNAGYSREVVDGYIAGQQALAREQTAAMEREMGGTENLQEMLTWAGKNLSKSDIEEFNASLDSGNASRTTMLLRGIRAEYERTNGKAPNLVDGTNGVNAAVGFKSTAQVVTAMSDARYKHDPAYRAEVEAKMKVSQF